MGSQRKGEATTGHGRCKGRAAGGVQREEGVASDCKPTAGEGCRSESVANAPPLAPPSAGPRSHAGAPFCRGAFHPVQHGVRSRGKKVLVLPATNPGRGNFWYPFGWCQRTHWAEKKKSGAHGGHPPNRPSWRLAPANNRCPALMGGRQASCKRGGAIRSALLEQPHSVTGFVTCRWVGDGPRPLLDPPWTVLTRDPGTARWAGCGATRTRRCHERG